MSAAAPPVVVHSTAGDSATREIVVTRDFKAPRELIFQLWTDPVHLSNWWGPYGFTTVTHERDLRPGGLWRFTMHGPDGRAYANTVSYVEVDEPERLVYDHRGHEAGSTVHFRAIVTFESLGDSTRVTLRSVFPTLDDYNVALSFGAIAGAHQTLDRFHRVVDSTLIHRELYDLNITRIFNAPRELVFEAFTNPEHLKQWTGPRAFTSTHYESDLRPGGKWRACIRQHTECNGRTDLGELWQGGVFKEIVPPERLVYTFAWEHQGLPSRETLITIHLIALDEKRTQMDFHQAFFDDINQRDGHNTGWNSSFDKLNEFVSSLSA